MEQFLCLINLAVLIFQSKVKVYINLNRHDITHTGEIEITVREVAKASVPTGNGTNSINFSINLVVGLIL